VHGIAADGVEMPFADNGQDWLLAWHPPTAVPSGRPHGGTAICLAGDQVVLVSSDGQRWGLPGGRPEPGEDWIDTVRREITEEACVTASDCRLLGYGRGVCMSGQEDGLVLVRGQWLAEVWLDVWEPRFEMTHRRLVPLDAAFAQLDITPGMEPFFRRMFAEAGLPY
jgi:8-oxo-dGTP pyrophosphatase MutT (NUDIX family)